MFGRSAPEPPPVPADAETRFCLPELRKLHKQLVENKRVNDANESLVIEILRVIAEMVVYGDNKSELLFDFFCEKNMLSLFLEIMRTPGGCPSAVHIQILQTLSILISCVRNDTSLYYLLSNNYVNEIIIFPHDFLNDESLCAQFASFMKSISLKLNVHTVQFFFIEESGAFPILTRAVELLTIPDPMIRIASQSTILNVYRVEDSRARAYALQDEVMGIMFAQMVNFMENQYHNIFKACKTYYKASNGNDEATASKVEMKLDDTMSAMEDWFFYLQDLLDLDVPVLRKALVHQLIHDFLLPVLLNPLMKNHHLYQQAEGKGKADISRLHSSSEDALTDSKTNQLRLSMVLGDAELELFDTIELIASLSYLLQMLKIVTHQALQRAVMVTLFHPLSLDCRTEILKEIEAARGATAGAVMTSPAEVIVSTVDAALDPALVERVAAKVPLTGNAIKEAWDRLHRADNPKVTLIMVYIEHILLERIVPTSIDATPGNEVLVPHEVDEDYLTTHVPAITPLRTINDPKSDAITMLQSLYFLPRKDYCEAQYMAAVENALKSATVSPPRPLPKPESNRSASTLSEGSADHNKGTAAAGGDMWSSELTIEDAGSADADGTATVSTANLTADCDAEAENGHGNRVTKVGFSSQPGSSGALGIAEEGNSPGHAEYGRLERSGEDDFRTPPLKSRHRVARNDMLMPTESTMGVGLNSADQLALPALKRMDEVMSERLPFYPEVKLVYSVEPVFGILCNAQGHSITTTHVACHLVYSLALLVASARNLAMPSAPGSKGTSFSGHPKSGSGSFSGPRESHSGSNAPLAERPSRVFFPEGCDPECLVHQSLLEFFLVRVREAGKMAALKLLVRLEGTLSETVLSLVKEEVARLDGQKWKRCIERMYQDVLLFLPPSQFNSERMGIDFDLPISQAETIRKEIQVFVMLRALYKRIHALSTSTSFAVPESVDDLCASITDKSVLCLEERNLLPSNYTLGTTYDMRGKRFLDVKIVPIAPKQVPEVTSPTPSEQARTASPARNGSSSSSWAKRFFGGGSSSSSAGPSPAPSSASVVASPISPVPGASNIAAAAREVDPIAQLASTKKKILFVQDAKSLVIVSCDKQDAKNNFKILIVAPLIYVDAQADPTDVQRFKLIVRSSGKVEHMYPAEPDMNQLLREGGNDSLLEHGGSEGSTPKGGAAAKPASTGPASAPKYPCPRLESAKFLKTKGKVNFWQLNLRVESEQACKLAVQHIENKRKEQTAAKMQQLQRMLEHWSSDAEVSCKDD